LRRQRRDRHDDADQEVGDADAQQRLQWIAELRLPENAAARRTRPRTARPLPQKSPIPYASSLLVWSLQSSVVVSGIVAHEERRLTEDTGSTKPRRRGGAYRFDGRRAARRSRGAVEPYPRRQGIFSVVLRDFVAPCDPVPPPSPCPLAGPGSASSPSSSQAPSAPSS
jgi:hypothetical protein